MGQECQRRNPDHTGREEYCYFLAVTFPAGQLRIIDYNRVVKYLNGLTSAQLLEKLAENFTVEDKGAEEYRPSGLHNFSMYLDGRWYSLTAKSGTYDDNDPIGVLDVTVLSNLVLDRILDIKDLRTSKRITTPERSFGSNHVVFGGMMLPVSAMLMSCCIETG